MPHDEYERQERQRQHQDHHHFFEPLTIRIEDNPELLAALDKAADRLERLVTKATKFKSEERKHMALSTAEQAIVDRFNAATTKVSDKIDKLIADSANMDDAEFNAQLQAIADGLDRLGTPAEPVPGPGPQPSPQPTP